MILIETASRQDLQTILELQYLAYQSEAKLLKNFDIPPLKQTLQEVEQEYAKGVILKALDDSNAIVGSVRGYVTDGTLYVGKLIVHPDLQGQGIGTKLLAEIERRCPHDRCELFTSSMSKRNINLYQRAGYKIFKESKVFDNLKFVYLEKSHSFSHINF